LKNHGRQAKKGNRSGFNFADNAELNQTFDQLPENEFALIFNHGK
jgi:hypothetical protein